MDASFVVPTRNEEKNIAKCLEAIRNQQTHLKYEIIVSDAHSKDRTREIARKYADKIVLQGKIPGIAAGRNSGAKVARGKILLFVDADTIVPPDYLEASHSILGKKDVVAASFYFKLPERGWKFRVSEAFINSLYLFLTAIGQAKLAGINICTRRDLFNKVGGFTDAPLEDWVFSDKIKKYGNAVFSSACKVTTSSRRVGHKGPFEALSYYIQLVIATYRPSFAKKSSLIKHKNYTPVE